MKINIHLGDSQQAMQSMKDNQYGLGIVDPPYGIDIAEWDKKELKPEKEYFNELYRISKNQIIWGANYFINNLKENRGWICWDKYFIKTGYAKEVDGFELAWTSFNNKAKILRYTSVGNTSGFDKNIKVDYNYKGKIHPTQKPIQLYKWLLKNYGFSKDGSKRTIFDSHAGSMSLVIACIDLGFDIDCWEIDEDYYNDAVKRIKRHLQQLDLTREPVEINYIQQRKD